MCDRLTEKLLTDKLCTLSIKGLLLSIQWYLRLGESQVVNNHSKINMTSHPTQTNLTKRLPYVSRSIHFNVPQYRTITINASQCLRLSCWIYTYR